MVVEPECEEVIPIRDHAKKRPTKGFKKGFDSSRPSRNKWLLKLKLHEIFLHALIVANIILVLAIIRLEPISIVERHAILFVTAHS